MNENLDLTKILKDAPKGMKLWSPVYGECTFINVDYFPNVMYPIHCKATTKDGKSTYVLFTIDGRIDNNYENSGCVLFPSKENKDWSTFEVPKTHKEFVLNQKVLVGLAFNNQYVWRRDIYLNYDEDTKTHCTFYEKEVPDSLIIPYDKDKDGKQVSSDLQDEQKDKKVNNNGFGYVDLGLPSGTFWATCNVGAYKPSEYGLYFQWGDTKGYTKDQVGKDKQFTWKNYKWNPSGDGETFTEYNTKEDTLYLEDDAANFNMKGSWHIPTPDQIQELIDNTTSEWTILDGTRGVEFTSMKDTSKSIFIPAAGYVWDGSVKDDRSCCLVWSSMIYEDYDGYANYLYIHSEGECLTYHERFYGFSVRGVIG